MIGHEQNVSTAENYRRFSRLEARGRSALYEQISASVAEDSEALAFLAALPPAKRQPNLLLAAVRFLAGAQPSYRAFRAVLLDRRREVAAVMHSRSTQTNEPARCAVLLPALARLPPPLALIEVGASAGLTLLPDVYGYDYGGRRIEPADPAAPVLACRPRGPVPVPAAVPAVAWRAGIDLNPLDVTDADDVAWLHSLIWPGEAGRPERLSAAVAVARRRRPRVIAGDLIEELSGLAAQAPAGATLVIYHTSVLSYVGSSRRGTFAGLVAELGAAWLSSESRGVLPWLPARWTAPEDGAHLLVRDGRDVLGLGDSHGAWLDWRERAIRPGVPAAGSDRRGGRSQHSPPGAPA